MSRKKKEWYMDYATHAFVRYANLGCPTRKEYEDRIKNDVYRRFALKEPNLIVITAQAEINENEPLLKDIDAVNRVFQILKETNKPHIANAIKDVYFPDPYGKPDKGVMKDRVLAYSIKCPASTKAVYSWLKSARLLFCKERGLNTGSKDEKW